MSAEQEELVLGVDLGTSRSAVAVFRAGSVDVLANDIDKRTTPSCVFVKDSERQVGEAALRLAASHPANTIRNVKSMLGQTFEPEKSGSLGAVQVQGAATGNGVVLRIENAEYATIFSPEEIAAMILLDLKKSAELQLRVPVNKVVMAVPSYFTAAQRKAVMDAGKLAGVHVPHLLNETTAAALAYAHDRGLEDKTVVMVDLGAGGSTVAVVKVTANAVEVLGHSGVRLPGGEDFDRTMMKWLTQNVKDKLDGEVTDPRDVEILRSQWATAKEKLSRVPQVTINVFLPGLGKDFVQDVKRSHFEEECGQHFWSITEGLQKTLKMTKVECGRVDDVLLVGGSSRIPRLRTLVEEAFPGKALCKALNPDEAVAQGAALLAAKQVKLAKEVMSLHTEFQTDLGTTTAPANSGLQYTFLPNWREKNIKILQEVEGGTLAAVYEGKLVRDCRIAIFASGLIKFAKADIEWHPIGCLPAADLQAALKKMQRRQQNEEGESRRLESKNALEDFLRRIRSEKIPEDCFLGEALRFHKRCSDSLEWLHENGNRKIQDYVEMHNELEEIWRDLNARRHMEMQTRMQRAEKALLRQTVEEIINGEVPDDPVRDRVNQLRPYCKGILDWLNGEQEMSHEEYESIRHIILNRKDRLQSARAQALLDERKAAHTNLLGPSEEAKNVHSVAGLPAWPELSSTVCTAVEDKSRQPLCHLQNKLVKGQQKFPGNSLLIGLGDACRERLLDRPEAASVETVNRVLWEVTEILRHLSLFKDYQLKQDEEARKAEAAAKRATDAMRPPSAVLSAPEPHPTDHQLTTTHDRVVWTHAHAPDHVEHTGQNAYEAMDYTEHGLEDVQQECVPGPLQANGLQSDPQEPTVVLPETTPECVPCVQCTPANKGHAQPPPGHVDPKLRREELQNVLEDVRLAKSMALLVDQETMDHRDFVSLSVRYLQDDGEAVEALLLWEEIRLSEGSSPGVASTLWTRFEELCRSVGFEWRSYVQFLSARTRGPHGKAFQELCKEKLSCDFQMVTSSAVPLDMRVALACYDRNLPTANRKESDLLVEFFEKVDLWRRTAAGSSSFHKHWPTYTSTVEFLSENRERLAKDSGVQGCNLNSQDEENVIRHAMNDSRFLVCLDVFHEVFAEFDKISRLMTDSSDYVDYRAALRNLISFCSSPYSVKRKVANIEANAAADPASRQLRKVILNAVEQVASEARRDFKECQEILQYLTSEGQKSSSCIDVQGRDELSRFREQFQSSSLDCPQRVLSKMPRFRFRESYPSLYAAMQRAVTAPLLPPAGLTSAQQLQNVVLQVVTEGYSAEKTVDSAQSQPGVPPPQQQINSSRICAKFPGSLPETKSTSGGN